MDDSLCRHGRRDSSCLFSFVLFTTVVERKIPAVVILVFSKQLSFLQLKQGVRLLFFLILCVCPVTDFWFRNGLFDVGIDVRTRSSAFSFLDFRHRAWMDMSCLLGKDLLMILIPISSFVISFSFQGYDWQYSDFHPLFFFLSYERILLTSF